MKYSSIIVIDTEAPLFVFFVLTRPEMGFTTFYKYFPEETEQCKPKIKGCSTYRRPAKD